MKLVNVPVVEIQVGDRIRKNVGPLGSLQTSIETVGMLHPIVVNSRKELVAGFRRLQVAKLIGWKAVPCVIAHNMDDALLALKAELHENAYRESMTATDMLELGRRIEELERPEAKKRQRDGGGKPGSGKLPEPKPPVRDKVAAAVGISGKTYDKIKQVVEAAEENPETFGDLPAMMDAQSVDAAHKELKKRKGEMKELTDAPALAQSQQEFVVPITPAVSLPLVQEHRPQDGNGRPSLGEYLTLDDWNEMHPDAALTWLCDLSPPAHNSRSKTMNRQDNDSIEWAQWSWNPVTGCLHACPYCYARDIAERFYPMKFNPAIWPERLAAPFNVNVPAQAADDIAFKNIFTCSMADLFGKWVPTPWINAVLDVVRACPQWNFLFLTKFPARMAEFDYPDNAWLGTSVDCQARVPAAEKAFRKVKAAVKWLSLEPILEHLTIDLSLFNWIVLGGASSSTQTPEWKPRRRWVLDIQDQAEVAGCRVYEKTNLWARRREYPGQQKTEVAGLPDSLRYLPSLRNE